MTRALFFPGMSWSELAPSSSSSPNELSAVDEPGVTVRVVVSNSRERCHSGRFESHSIS